MHFCCCVCRFLGSMLTKYQSMLKGSFVLLKYLNFLKLVEIPSNNRCGGKESHTFKTIERLSGITMVQAFLPPQLEHYSNSLTAHQECCHGSHLATLAVLQIPLVKCSSDEATRRSDTTMSAANTV